MTGLVTQLIALISHGNAYLRNARRLDDFYPANDVFRFCKTVSFVDVEGATGGARTVAVAPDPIRWLEYLKQNQCQRLRFDYAATPFPRIPDFRLVSFAGGGGYWQIIALMPDHHFRVCRDKGDFRGPLAL